MGGRRELEGKRGGKAHYEMGSGSSCEGAKMRIITKTSLEGEGEEGKAFHLAPVWMHPARDESELSVDSAQL